ncbi:MAG: M23 family metallopeptidase [bacterium]
MDGLEQPIDEMEITTVETGSLPYGDAADTAEDPEIFSIESSSSIIQLWCPWTSGQTWIGGSPGSYFGEGYHTGKDYYAIDFNKQGTANADDGESICAAADGTISFISTDNISGGYGWYVRIDHGNGWQTLYAHLKYNPTINPGVKVGQLVTHGTCIGKCGMTGGTSTGIHLHFCLYKDGVSKKPSPMSGQEINRNPTTLVSNNSPVLPGQCKDGSIDSVIKACFKSNGSVSNVGTPIENGGGLYVHAWGPSNSWWVQDFNGGSFGKGIIIKKKHTTNAYCIHGVIWDKYSHMTDAWNKLGLVVSNEYAATRSPWKTNGTFSRFEKGTIYYNSRTGKAYPVLYSSTINWNNPKVNTKTICGYYETHGGTGGSYGFPIGERTKGKKKGLTYYSQKFEGGTIGSYIY